MTKSSNSSETMSWISLVLSVVFFILSYFIGRWSGFFVVSALAWPILGAALIWFVLALQFRQRILAEREKLDMMALESDQESSTIFQSGGERASLMAVAQKRLVAFEKWFLPIFAGFIGVYFVAVGGWLLKTVWQGVEQDPQQHLIAAVTMTLVAFVSFLMSRYATGMSAQSQWRPLRAGGSAFLVVAVLCFTLAIGLALIQFQIMWLLNIVSWVIPCLMLALGAETLLNVVFDIYRPRVAGQYNRAAFDSRLLGIVNEPGGLLHSMASAIDYQFGFKVSQTWFYKLLEKAIVPLVLFGIITLYLLTSIVIVGADEEAIVEHFGNPMRADGEIRHLTPGLAVKWPWPIDIAYRYPVRKIEEAHIGYVPKQQNGEWTKPEPLLWGKSHYEEEHSVVVASEYTGFKNALEEGALPVSLIKANVPVQYRVKDIYQFLYGHKNPKELLSEIGHKELAKLVASSRIEAEDGASDSLLGAGRTQAGRMLKERIQAEADRFGLGIEIVFVGMQGIHPPAESDVATKYHEVVSSTQEQQTLVLQAHADRNTQLSSLAGTVDQALALADLATEYQSTNQDHGSPEAQELVKQLDEGLSNAKGEIYKILTDAQAYAYEKPTLAQATGLRFKGQVKAYQAAPNIYMRQERLQTLIEALPDVRKYVLLGDPNDHEVVIVDLAEELNLDLGDITGFQGTN